MTKYKIKQSSPLIFILSWIILLFGLILIFVFLAKNLNFVPKGKPFVFILIAVPIAFLAFYLSKLISTIDILLIMDENGLEKKWMSQFIFMNRENAKLDWADISDYVFQPDRQFDQFKIKLKNGEKFKFYHNNDHDNKDDFQKFLSDFEEKVLEINFNNSETKSIQKGKTIYETFWGLVLGGLAVLIIVGIPILLILNPVNKSANYGVIAFSYIGAIYFLFQVYLHRKKGKH